MTHERAQDAAHLSWREASSALARAAAATTVNFRVVDAGARRDRLLTEHVLPALQR